MKQNTTYGRPGMPGKCNHIWPIPFQPDGPSRLIPPLMTVLFAKSVTSPPTALVTRVIGNELIPRGRHASIGPFAEISAVGSGRLVQLSGNPIGGCFLREISGKFGNFRCSRTKGGGVEEAGDLDITGTGGVVAVEKNRVKKMEMNRLLSKGDLNCKNENL